MALSHFSLKGTIASDAASFVTGTMLVADGGYTTYEGTHQ